MKEFFYELKHDIGADYFTVEEAESFSFPMHMHRCYEIILLGEGSMHVRIEKSEYVLGAGDMVLIKPNRVHSIESSSDSRHKLCSKTAKASFALSPPESI